MQLNKRFWLIILVVLALALTGCDSDSGGDSDNGGGGDSTQTAVELGQTFTASNGVSLNYPDGWTVVEESGIISIANEESVITALEFEAGQIGGRVILLPDTATDQEGIDTILQGFIDTTLGEDDSAQMTFSDIETFDANGQPSAIVTGEGSDVAGALSLANIVVDVGDSIVLFSYAASAGEMEQFTETIRAIASSVTYDSSGAGAEG